MTLGTWKNESDGQLIRRFAEGRDERAFGELVQRHGRLVAGVCARMLKHIDDAEDACQAVFMVLARRAPALLRRDSLASWLHGVAVRVCLNEWRSRRRRRWHPDGTDRLARVSERGNHPEIRELKQMIDEELASLPSQLREVLVLCDLESRSRTDVARILSLPTGTVTSRLTRGRDLMRRRLLRRGVILSAAGVSTALTSAGAAAPNVSVDLVSRTVRNAQVFLSGTEAASANLNAQILQLAQGVLHSMLLNQWKLNASFFIILASSLFGGAVGSSFLPRFTALASANTLLSDSFDDGSITDGIPTSWRPASEIGLANGSFNAVSGDFVLTPAGDDTVAAVLDPPAAWTDISVRVQLRNQGGTGAQGQATGIFARAMLTPPDPTAVEAGIDVDGELYIAEIAPKHLILGTFASDLHPLQEDVILQFDMVGDTLKLSAWRADGIMPQLPQVTAKTSLLQNGTLGIFHNPPDTNGSATFRYIQVSAVPEPVLGAASSGLLALVCLFWWRTQR